MKNFLWLLKYLYDDSPFIFMMGFGSLIIIVIWAVGLTLGWDMGAIDG